MIRQFLTSLIIFIGLTTLVNAECNFKIANFGSTKDNLNFDENLPQPFSMPDQFGGENLIMPLESICKNDDKLYGTNLILLYVDNKLIRIQLYRPIMQDRNLMDYAMNKYGIFNLPEGLPKDKWRGSYVWEKNNEIIEYIMTNIHDGHVEILEISNKLYQNEISNYNEKVGEWLDTRK